MAVDWTGTGPGFNIANSVVTNSASLLEAQQEQAFKRQKLAFDSELETAKLMQQREQASMQNETERYKHDNASAYESGILANDQEKIGLQAERDSNENTNKQAELGIQQQNADTQRQNVQGSLAIQQQEAEYKGQDQANKNTQFAQSQMERQFLMKAGQEGGLQGSIDALTQLGHSKEAADLQKTLTETRNATYAGENSFLEGLIKKDALVNTKTARMISNAGKAYLVTSKQDPEAALQALRGNAAMIDAANAEAGTPTNYSSMNDSQLVTALPMIAMQQDKDVASLLQTPGGRQAFGGQAQNYFKQPFQGDSGELVNNYRMAKESGDEEAANMFAAMAKKKGSPSTIVNTGEGNVNLGSEDPVNGISPNTTPNVTKLQQEVAKFQGIKSNLERINKEKDLSLLEMKKSWIELPAAKTADFLGTSSPEQKALIDKEKKFSGAMDRSMAYMLKEFSGVAVAEPEFKRWSKMWVNRSLSPQEYLSTYDSIMSEMDNYIDINQQRLKQGGIDIGGAKKQPTYDDVMSRITKLSQSNDPADLEEAEQLMQVARNMPEEKAAPSETKPAAKKESAVDAHLREAKAEQARRQAKMKEQLDLSNSTDTVYPGAN